MKKLTIRCSDEEYAALMEYCELVERSQNEVLRECIRRLKPKKKPS